MTRAGLILVMAPLLAACATGPSVPELPPLPPKTGPTYYDSLKAKPQGPRRHIPDPVRREQLGKDSAKCRAQMKMVPISPILSPSVVEMHLYSFFIDCMEGEGCVSR